MNSEVTAAGSKQATAAPSGPTKKGQTGISKAVDIHVTPEVVYRAVSTADGLRGWWCKNVTLEGGPEGILSLGFPGGHVTRIRLAKGEAASRAEWDVLDHNAMPEWIDTRLVFAIEQNGPMSSRLQFHQAGLNQGCECYGACNDAWGYLMGSLKVFLENGKGTPA
jgi:uncharacterized protein YndB with AHSA1/START domain